MGQTCSKKSLKTSENLKIEYQSKKTSSFHRENKEKEHHRQKISFKISLENLKAKNFSQNDIHIYFNFANFYRTFTIHPVSKSENPQFKFNEEFEYTVTRLELKDQTAIMTIRDSNKKDLASIKLNLYEVAIGPFHHDMILQNKSLNFKGRILFDLKMTQKITFFVEPKFIHTTAKESLKEKAYNFNIKILNSEGEINSEHSDNIFNQFYMGKAEILPLEEVYEENENFEMAMNEALEKQNIKSYISRHLPTNERHERSRRGTHTQAYDKALLLKKNISKQSIKSPNDSPRCQRMSLTKSKSHVVNEKYKRELTWNFKENFKREPPCLEAEIYANEFSLNSLQFCLWGTNNPEELSNNYSEEEVISKKEDNEGDHMNLRNNKSLIIHFVDLKLIGECYWSFNKIFREDFHAYDLNDDDEYIISNKLKIFTESLRNHGSLVGEVEVHFHIELTPFLRQTIGGIRTESGVKNATSLIHQNHKILDNLNYSAKLKELLNVKETLIISVLKLLDKSKMHKAQIKEKAQSEVMTNIRKAKNLLAQDSSSFVYKSEEELFQSQNILVDFAEHLLNYSDEIDEKIREMYYELLTIVCNREELNLHSMGFDQSTYEYLQSLGAKMTFQKGQSRSKTELKFLALKMKIGLNYQSFLYETLLKILSKFTQKAINVKEKFFIENFCAYAYFRIPEFRHQFLECFIEQNKEQEQLFEIFNDPKQKPIGLATYDWEKNFHKFLKTSPKGVKHLQEFLQKLDEIDWKTAICKKEPLFFSLMAELCRSVYYHKINKFHIPWNEIPGYAVLVNTLMLELKNRSVIHYHKNIKEASKYMLLNEKLLGAFVMIVYKNTRVYDATAVFHTFELIDSWLNFLDQEKKSISTVFDYSFFFKGIKLVLEQDHAVCIARCLYMIYNNYVLFPTTFRKELCGYFFSGMFFKFFMHWHPSVRKVFHYFLIYRIHHLHRNSKTNMTDITDLYKELMKPHDYQKKNHIINDVIFVWYSNMLKTVEDTKSSLESEEENFIYDLSPINALRIKMNKPIPMSHLKKQVFSISSPNLNTAIPKKTSLVLENSFLESEKETIKSALLKNKEEMDNMVKSLSNFTNPIETGEKEAFSLKDMKDSEGNESRTNFFTKEFADLSPLKLTNKGKIYINRRNIYFDKDEKKYLQIPKEYLKYLFPAYREFEKLKKVYWDWFINQKAKLSKLSEEELKQAFLNIKVPQIKIAIVIDEMERSEEEALNEW